MRNLSPAVKHLIIINVLFFLATAMLPFDLRSLFAVYFPMSSEFKPFQIITSMFMHADVMHLGFNMLSLFFLGPYVERSLGTNRFLILYFLAGFAATFLNTAVNYFSYVELSGLLPPEAIDYLLEKGRSLFLQGPNAHYPDIHHFEFNLLLNQSTLGASGAVYGVLIAFATMYPNMKLMLLIPPIPIKAKYLAIGLIIYDLVFGIGSFQGDKVAHFAHLGGAIAGFLLIIYWNMARLR